LVEEHGPPEVYQYQQGSRCQDWRERDQQQQHH
jgi:hypothetical protein